MYCNTLCAAGLSGCCGAALLCAGVSGGGQLYGESLRARPEGELRRLLQHGGQVPLGQ